MKSSILILMAVCMSIGIAFGDYANPPGWENNAYFTHQSWSFSTPDNPSAPDDGGTGNPYGTGSFNLTAANQTWVDDLGMVYATDYTPLGQRQGGWRLDGPSGTRDVEREDWFTIDIPNTPNPDLTKEVWIELTFMVRNLGHAGTISSDVDLQIFANGDTSQQFDYLGAVEEGIGGSLQGEIWVRAASTFSFFPQPGDEQIVLSGWLDDGFYVILDQVDVDTRCIPEPASISLLGIGVLGLIRRRKNR